MLYFCSQTLVSLERRSKFLEGRLTRPESLAYPGRACPKAKATYGCPRGRCTNGHQRTEFSSNKNQVFQVNNDLEELPLEYDRLWMIMDTYGWLSGFFLMLLISEMLFTRRGLQMLGAILPNVVTAELCQFGSPRSGSVIHTFSGLRWLI